MPSAVSPQRRADSTGPDDLDKLLDYDNAVDDFLRDIPIGGDDQQNTANNTTTDQPRDEDQEVEVKRKRKPIPKLDENRLLSDAGIPRLRKITKSKLKFRGKGHAFSDISRLLNTYQLWLDDLYPRAKFRDALTMVEKVGHSKRMQVMRRTWLEDTKPYRKETTPDLHMSGGAGDGTPLDLDIVGTETNEHDREQNGSANEGLDDLLGEGHAEPATKLNNAGHRKGPFEDDDEPDDDELDALLAENSSTEAAQTTAKPTRRGPFEEDDPDEDELDALMGEQHPGNSSATATRKVGGASGDDFADDEEALASMGVMW